MFLKMHSELTKTFLLTMSFFAKALESQALMIAAKDLTSKDLIFPKASLNTCCYSISTFKLLNFSVI